MPGTAMHAEHHEGQRRLVEEGHVQQGALPGDEHVVQGNRIADGVHRHETVPTSRSPRPPAKRLKLTAMVATRLRNAQRET